jgi:Kef-type K+ transport system membrane component KefB
VFVEATLFAMFMILVAPRIIRRMQPGIKRLSTQNAPLVLALAICLGFSAMAERIGMAAIIGAFFAGLAFAEYAPEWGLRERIGGITEFLAPLFFFTMGARLNLTVFSGDVLITASVITILAILSKLVGCGLPAWREGWQNMLRVGVGMVPRGEVGLIVALVGLNMNAISQQAYAIVIFMTGVTTLVAPPFLRVLFRDAEPLPHTLEESVAAAE